MRFLVALVAVLAAGTASADPQPWMKKANPNELQVMTLADEDCPISGDEARRVVEGVLVRARIKVVSDISQLPALLVRVTCIANEVGPYSVHVDFVGVDSATRQVNRLGLLGYFGSGAHAGVPANLWNAIEGTVEGAITDYLKANFDL